MPAVDPSRILTHRLRKFSEIENTLSALRSACGAALRYFEIDTRVTADGTIFVYHNPVTGPELSGRLAFADASAADVRRLVYRTGERIAELSELAAEFAARAREDQRLCIDIKDFGFEREHLSAVRAAGIEDRVHFVSWIPQSLLRLREIGAATPLVLSHWNMLRFGLRGRIASALLRRQLFRLRRFVFLGAARTESPLGRFARGVQHGLVCRELTPRLVRLLSDGGGICVHASAVDRTLVDYARRSGIELWVFGAEREVEFLTSGIGAEADVMFCDDAPAVLRAGGLA